MIEFDILIQSRTLQNIENRALDFLCGNFINNDQKVLQQENILIDDHTLKK